MREKDKKEGNNLEEREWGRQERETHNQTQVIIGSFNSN